MDSALPKLYLSTIWYLHKLERYVHVLEYMMHLPMLNAQFQMHETEGVTWFIEHANQQTGSVDRAVNVPTSI